MQTATVTATLDIFDKFISVSKELAKLPQLVLPQYSTCAQDLYEISQKLLAANENLSRWMFNFLYFNFGQTEAAANFSKLLKEYKSMKAGPEFSKLRFSCGDIGSIYYRNVSSKLMNWFTDQTKLEKAQGVFAALTDIDRDLVDFTYQNVVKALDSAVGDMEKLVDKQDLAGAEARRLQAKAEMKEIADSLQKFGGDLADLTLSFAGLAHVSDTLPAP